MGTFLDEQSPNLEDEGRGDPGDDGGIDGGEGGPAPRTCLVLDGGYCGDTGEVEQYKYKVRVGSQWGDAFL